MSVVAELRAGVTIWNASISGLGGLIVRERSFFAEFQNRVDWMARDRTGRSPS